MTAAAPGRQGGVALITAVLVVALASSIAVATASRQQVDVRRTEHLLHRDQAWFYYRGMEAWAAAVLRRDASDNDTDSGLDDWARRLPPLPVEGGQVSGFLEDLQGRFNLNSLVRGDGGEDPAAMDRFRRLLGYLDLDAALAEAVADWIDRDLEPRFPDGAEDDEYLRAEPAYRSANRPFASVTELRLVKGVTDVAYTRLAPLLTALPEPTPVNVNTAPAAVLASLAEGLTLDEAQQIVNDRAERAFAGVGDFLAHPALAGRASAVSGIAVGSRYFLLRGSVTIGRNQLNMSTILRRGTETGEVVVMRDLEGR